MQFCNANAGQVRDELDKILASPGFARNDRLSRFLRFIVEEALEGKGSELKESLLGVEVFDRKPGFDPKQDSVVRTEAAKLCDRLSKYYAADGAADPIVIVVEKGGYVPVFRPSDAPVRKNRTPPGIRLGFKAALAGIALLLVSVAAWWIRPKSAPVRIAVMPLRNISADSGNDYYADGLTSEIISNLSTFEGIAVRSQTSSFALKGKPRNVSDVGKQLAVDYILEGCILRSDRELRVNVQFVRVRDDFLLWSGQFDRAIASEFAIQDEISRGVVNSVRLTLGRGRRRYETSTEAYELYLRARAAAIHNPPGDGQTIGLLEQVIARDPTFAPAHADLAVAYAARSNRYRFDTAEETGKMRAAAERAFRLDPLLAEAHHAMALACARDAQWQQSEKFFQRAIELGADRSTTSRDFSYFLLVPLGRTKEALRQLRLARENDPLATQIHFQLAWLLISAGRNVEAEAYCRSLPGDFPDRNKCLGRALLGLGRTEEAIRILARRDDSSDKAYLGYAYARSGRREEAEKLAAGLSSRPLHEALVFAGLGDRERTLKALHRMAVVGPVRTAWILRLPELALLRGDPRLKLLQRNVGLPE